MYPHNTNKKKINNLNNEIKTVNQIGRVKIKIDRSPILHKNHYGDVDFYISAFTQCRSKLNTKIQMYLFV